MADGDRNRTGRDARREPEDAGRGLVLRVARRRFLEHGYAATSMSDIAADAGVTKAALYYHFPGKDALFTAVFTAEVERLIGGLRSIAGEGGSLAEVLTRIAAYALHEAGDGAVRLHDEFLRHIDPAVVEASLCNLPSPLDVLGAVVERHRADLRDGLDPMFVAESFFGLVMSCGNADKWHPNPVPIGPDDAPRLVDLILNGSVAR